MRKAVIRGLCGLGLSALVIAVSALMLRPNTPTTDPAKTSPATSPTEVTAPTIPPYAVVGAWEGQLAVFRAGEAAPSEVHDVFIASLPKAEQTALESGISVYDEVELQRLLEDYTG